MKSIITVIAFFLLINFAFAQKNDSLLIRQIYDETLVNGRSYQNLEYLCKKIGPRLSGSINAQKAVDWTKKLMEEYKFDRVFLQEVMVPHWVRGAKEEAKIINGKNVISVSIVALGGSVATPKTGLTAEVIEVQSLAELNTLGKAVLKGKIVFFNRKFDPKPIETGTSYGMAGDQRFSGPVEAAKYGAVGVIVRSLTHSVDDNPHTGATQYSETGVNIPAAAISTKGANQLSHLLKSNPSTKLFFKQSCQTLPDVLSYNVVGEIRGSERPDEIINVGAHLDSWDLAEGAHDDGTGIVQSIEVLRVFKAIDYRPKRTLRAIMFINEENGNRGGLKYAELAKLNNENHIAAIESDAGGFTPRGFSFETSIDLVRQVNGKWKSLLEPYDVDHLSVGYSGTDIGPLKSSVPNIVLIGFRPDSQRYFDIHHSQIDVFENVHKRELELGAASIAALVYLIDQNGFK